MHISENRQIDMGAVAGVLDMCACVSSHPGSVITCGRKKAQEWLSKGKECLKKLKWPELFRVVKKMTE